MRPRILRTTMALVAATVVLLTPGVTGASTHASTHMPNLIGRSRLAVYRIMRSDHLYFVTHGPGSQNDHWARVTSQSPRAGTVIAWHGEANLTVTNHVPRAPRAVPRLIGLSRAEVYAAMHHAQLFFKTTGPGSSSGTWVVALAQSPRAGTRVAWHDQITLRVSTRRPRPVVATVARAPVKATSVVISGTSFKVGVATWYDYVPGRCATWYLPKGTRITVRDLTTGKSITCVITDREDHGGNRVVDLSASQFSQLAPLWKGVISVKVSW